MNTQNIESIFFDIDGTLVSFETHKMPQSALDALHALRAKGIKLFIATGRPRASLSVVDEFSFDGYITLNGQCCLDRDGAVIYENPMHKADIAKLVEHAEQNQIACYFVERSSAYYNMRNDSVTDLEMMINTGTQPVGDVQDALRNDIYQVTAFVDEHQEREMMQLMPNSLSARWYPTFCDISPLGGTKENGIKHLCAHLGIDMENTMAFGDGGNDIPMLGCVGLSVGMGNANEQVKAMVDYVTDDVDKDGVYNALKHFNLI